MSSNLRVPLIEEKKIELYINAYIELYINTYISMYLIDYSLNAIATILIYLIVFGLFLKKNI